MSEEDVISVKIFRLMQAQYGNKFLSCSKSCERIDHFKNWRTSLCDEERSGRPQRIPELPKSN